MQGACLCQVHTAALQWPKWQCRCRPRVPGCWGARVSCAPDLLLTQCMRLQRPFQILQDTGWWLLLPHQTVLAFSRSALLCSALLCSAAELACMAAGPLPDRAGHRPMSPVPQRAVLVPAHDVLLWCVGLRGGRSEHALLHRSAPGHHLGWHLPHHRLLVGCMCAPSLPDPEIILLLIVFRPQILNQTSPVPELQVPCWSDNWFPPACCESARQRMLHQEGTEKILQQEP